MRALQSPSPHSVVLKDQVDGQSKWLVFENPIAIVQAHRLDDVAAGLRAVRGYQADGFHAAGFVSYEASPALDPALQTHPAGDLPLLWFAICRRPQVLDALPEPGHCDPMQGEWQPSVSVDDYHRAIAEIRDRIRDGDTYQVNYTFHLRNRFLGDPWELFLRLQAAQSAEHCAFVKLDRYSICSASPELFFSHDDGRVECKPMKGTVKRGASARQDLERARWLQTSEKNRSENVMIVDMIRNDLGTLAEVGSVQVERIFDIEKYPTVHQMTSTVTARTAHGPVDVLEKMFPCASITGAPKVKTMEIIAGLEPERRGVYTGAIGHVSPHGRSKFNVAIRTVVVDTLDGTADYGVGGGITWDSEAADEYEECKAKAAVLMREPARFDLLETMLWDPAQGLYLLDLHLQRLTESAAYFDFDLSMTRLHDEIGRYLAQARAERCGARLTVSRRGEVTLRSFDLQPVRGSRVALGRRELPAPAHVCHKTTDRRAYDQARAQHPVCQDVILSNAAGFITESCIANVVIERDGEWLTPELEQGLLPGVFRQHLLHTGVVAEARLTLQALLEAPAVYLVNSVRGWMPLHKDGDATWRVGGEFIYAPPARTPATA